MKKEYLDKFIKDVDVLRMPIREIIATAYELGRLHEKTGVDKEEREAADIISKKCLRAGSIPCIMPRPNKDISKTDPVCMLYCENYMECCGIEKDKETCGTYMVLKDRHGEEALKIMKGETK